MPRFCKVFPLAIALGCYSPVGPMEPEPWTTMPTSRGYVAASGEWMVTVSNGDLEVGVSAGIGLYYRGEPVGGGGIYALFDGTRTWDEWLPLVAPTGDVRLTGFALEGDGLRVTFREASPSVAPVPLHLSATIRPVGDGIEMALDGMHMVFFSMQLEPWQVRTNGAKPVCDMRLEIGYDSRDWWHDFHGPASFELGNSHFRIDFYTDNLLTKLGVGRDGVGGELGITKLAKLDLDHSFQVGRYSAESVLRVSPRY